MKKHNNIPRQKGSARAHQASTMIWKRPKEFSSLPNVGEMVVGVGICNVDGAVVIFGIVALAVDGLGDVFDELGSAEGAYDFSNEKTVVLSNTKDDG